MIGEIFMRKKKNKIERTPREDGNETKIAIIETAGQLIAKQGYDKTSSKEICQTLKIGLAAVNYHFGSRENLYREILKKVYKYFLSLDELKELEEKNLSPQEKIEKFFDLLIKAVQEKNNWEIRVWLRELISPSNFAKKMVLEEVLPKLKFLVKIFCDYTNLSADDPKLHACIVSSFSPFFWILIFQREEVKEIREIIPLSGEKTKMLQELKNFSLKICRDLKNS